MKVTASQYTMNLEDNNTEYSGDAAPNATSVTSHVESQDLLEKIKFKAAEGIKGFMIGRNDFLREHYFWLINTRHVDCPPHPRKDHANY